MWESLLMSIEITCSCGKRYRVADEHAGRKMRCRACQQILAIPLQEEPTPTFEATLVPQSQPQQPVPEQVFPTPQNPHLPDEWFVHSHDGNDYGPVTKQELDSWFAEGLFTPQCQLRQQGGEWLPVHSVYPQTRQSESSLAQEPASGGFPMIQTDSARSTQAPTIDSASVPSPAPETTASDYEPVLFATGKKKSIGNMVVNGDVKKLAGTTLVSSDIYDVGEPRSLLDRLQAGAIVGNMKASEVDVAQLQLFRMKDAIGEYAVVVPFDSGMIAPLEYVAILPGCLPAALTLFKQSGGKVALEAGAVMGGPLGHLLANVGSKVTSVWAGPQGDVPAIAEAANAQPGLGEGIRWEGKMGGGPVSHVYRIHWGVQAIPLTNESFLLVAQSVAKQKVIGLDFGVAWFANYRKAFATFVAQANGQSCGEFDFFDPGLWLPVSIEVMRWIEW